MGKIHVLLKEHGKQGALELGLPRNVVETAAAYMTHESSDTEFLYSGFALAGLPHKRLKDDAVWQVATDHATLIVQPGMKANPGGAPIPVGVPYGSRARLICLYLQSTALRTGGREVPLGDSLSDWMRRMSIPIGGKSMNMVRDQAERIARCRLSFEVRSGGRRGLMNQNIMDAALFLDEEGSSSKAFLERAVLSEGFFNALTKHPVPIEESAIVALSNNSMAMDIYCWLAYRLHALDAEKPTHISWPSLHLQFGAGIKRVRDFRSLFKSALELALSTYPDARIEDNPRGLVLYKSKPPVLPKVATLALVKSQAA